ncbi:hypothetical protein SARC_08963 [Sphaeroforma arctica JP610]|uniref:F-box domain-containing protein n=1 Tax=Sphaeroforma arctica JP610 TaxID=667725 RepID=A0A0L0FPA1_9EUKA|nr:hypothetical protein SARC_08963 [Sphaeroforma arctica JP610]KNC78617.1 hypothetical protein SARC_08963 [Sphaeroforma arctica JP610]|eukprot:XP_014152519.1 hypothetical protein SARC_08963 [Sphaeroforma arctica JP610]
MEGLQFMDLPTDIHQLLMTYLQLSDLRELACTCKHFSQASKATHVYTEVLRNELRAGELGSTHHIPKGTLERVLHRAWSWEKVVNAPVLDLVLNANKRSWAEDAFVYACGRGCVDFVKLLLSRRFKIRPDSLENGGIERACKNGHVQIALLLLNWHNTRTEDSRNHLDEYDSCDNFESNRIGLNHVANEHESHMGVQKSAIDVNPSVNNDRSFRLACRNNQVAVVNILLADKRVDPSAKSSEGIRVACKRGYAELLEVLLLDGRSDPGVSNNLPLRLAVKSLSLRAVAMLVDDRRVDPSVNEHEPLKYATRHARNDIAILLRKGERQRESASTWSGNRNPMLTPLDTD